MKRRVEKYRPKNIQQLSYILQSVWNNLSYYTINGLIDSFPKKIQKCIQNNGAQVIYPYNINLNQNFLRKTHRLFERRKVS